VDEQADKVSPAMTSIRKERMNLLLQASFVAGTINGPPPIVKHGADLCTQAMRRDLDQARAELHAVVVGNIKHLMNHPSV
jgi:hypothetical protein